MNAARINLLKTFLLTLLLSACSSYPSQANMTQVPTITGTREVGISSIASSDLSRDGSLLVVGGRKGVAVYSTDTMEELWSQPIDGIKYVSFSPDDLSITMVEDTGLVIIADSQTGELKHGLDFSSKRLPSSSEMNLRGDLLTVGLWGGGVVVWDLDNQERVYLWDEHYERRQAGAQETLVEWSSDSKLLVAGGWFDEVAVWDIETGELIQEFLFNFDAPLLTPIAGIALSPDDAAIAALNENGGDQIAIWDIQSGELVRRLTAPIPIPHILEVAPGGPNLGISWSPDGAFLATATTDGKILIWETGNYSVVDVLEAPEQYMAVSNIDWSPQGDRLYVGMYGGAVMIWDIMTGEAVHTLTGIFP